jgi:hypothetical protein
MVRMWLPLGLNYFNPIDRGSMFLRNVRVNVQNYALSTSRRLQPDFLYILVLAELIAELEAEDKPGPYPVNYFRRVGCSCIMSFHRCQEFGHDLRPLALRLLCRDELSFQIYKNLTDSVI